MKVTDIISRFKNTYTRLFYKKLRIWASTESFLKLSDFEYSEFLTGFLKVPKGSIPISMSTTRSLRTFQNMVFLKPILKYCTSNMILETSGDKMKIC